MSNFCNQFDKVCTELGVAVIYCHHHSKGSQGSKKSMDRASGSGVFARDPDAMLDMIELELSEEALKQEENKAPILNGKMTCPRMIFAAVTRCSITAKTSWMCGSGQTFRRWWKQPG